MKNLYLEQLFLHPKNKKDILVFDEIVF